MTSSTWLFCFVACVQLLRVPVECARKLINIDYLGRGYDALQGNPQSDLEDPGFRLSVFQLEYTKKTVTADGRFWLPDHTSVSQLNSCGFLTESDVVHDVKSYRESLLVGIFVFFYFVASYILIRLLLHTE